MSNTTKAHQECMRVFSSPELRGDERAMEVALNAYRTALLASAYDRHQEAQRLVGAHNLAAKDAASAVRYALDEVNNCNYGYAKDALEGALDRGLPNDHGGPVTIYPYLERRLES